MSALFGLFVMAAVAAVEASNTSPPNDDHLVPEESVYTAIQIQEKYPEDSWSWTYEVEVVRRFSEAFGPDVVGRMLVFPLNGREYSVALVRDDGQYRVRHLELSANMLEFEDLDNLRARLEETPDESKRKELTESIGWFESHLPPSRDDIVVNRCERKIPNELGAKLYMLWSEMLFRTRYQGSRPAGPDDPGVLSITIGDVTHYHFSFDFSGVRMEGRIINPGKDSNTGKFAAIANLLRDACGVRRNGDILADMEQRVDELTATLAETVY